jgi:transposase
VIWLTGRLAPDHKTIADFRKDNGPAIRKVCARFVALCRELGLLTNASVAIDGSKFKAVNTRDKNFTRAKMERRLAQIEESVARYLSQLDTADLQEPSEALVAKTAHLKEKLAKLATEVERLKAIEKEMLASPDQQISLTDPDSRSMATSGRGSGVVGYNVQVAVDTEHHLIVAHEVTNAGSDRSQLANIASQAKDVLGADHLDAVADRGYFNSVEILACEQADITVTLPKPMTSGAKADGRFGKQDFAYLPTSRAAGHCAIIGRRHARDARSSHSARTDPSGALSDGNTNTCSKPCSSVSIRTRRRCANGARQLSIHSRR